MCAIAGIYSVEQSKLRTHMSNMLAVMTHRGPEDSNYYIHNNFCLGHNRLSIIDISGGKQPMSSANGRYVISFNGEIYNYKALQQRIINNGHHVQTNSDTEVVLRLFELEGPEMLVHLNGIFAFCILDTLEDKIFFARDHFGIKPFHYYHDSKHFIFSSEQKGILATNIVIPEMNKSALHVHLNLRYTQGSETLIKSIKRLKPGHYGSFSAKSGLKIEEYWSPYEAKTNNLVKTFEEAKEGVDFYLRQAVQSQLVSDVPVGIYLSGGLDSSSIVQKVHEIGVDKIFTFTLGFNEPTDEHKDSMKIVKEFNTIHHSLNLSMEPMSLLPKVIWHAEEPKINLLQGFHMSQFVSEHVKVALGGLGGDELFAGYDIHRFLAPLKNLPSKIPKWLKRLFKLKSKLIYSLQSRTNILRWDEYRRGAQMLLAIGEIAEYYLITRNVWDFDRAALYKIYNANFAKEMAQSRFQVLEQFIPHFEKVKDMDALEQVLFVEMNSKMVNDYLLVEDRMSMANSVEERVPFLDLDLYKFAMSIPVNMKYQKGTTKFLLRETMRDKLPEDIIQKKKWGFTINPVLLFQRGLQQTCKAVLTEDRIRSQGVFNYEYLNRIMNSKPHPRMRWHFNLLYIILGLHYWEELFLNNHSPSDVPIITNSAKL